MIILLSDLVLILENNGFGIWFLILLIMLLLIVKIPPLTCVITLTINYIIYNKKMNKWMNI